MNANLHPRKSYWVREMIIQKTVLGPLASAKYYYDLTGVYSKFKGGRYRGGGGDRKQQVPWMMYGVSNVMINTE